LGSGGSQDLTFFRYLAAHHPGLQVLAVHHYPEFPVSDIDISELDRRLLELGKLAVFNPAKRPEQLESYIRSMLLSETVGQKPTQEVVHLEKLDDFLRRDTLTAFYQPIVQLDGNRGVVAYEALARALTDTLLGNPALLFSYAALRDYYSKIDQACTSVALKNGVSLSLDFDLFINVQPRSLTDPNFTEHLHAAVIASGRMPANVVVELTEQREILNQKMFSAGVYSLKEMGFRIAVDDFGEGNSNLEMVLHVAPEILKISGRICRFAAKNKVVRSMIGAIAGMCREEGILTVAEFIETEQDAEIMTELGVDLGQGWHLGKPAPANLLAQA
jgi:EAL domain-containing protein (putative c-di-GMP-specific phosphodiesterase class I)